MTDLAVIRGDDQIIDLVVTDVDTGDPVNLSGATIWMTVKVRSSDPESLALIQKTTASGITITNPADGEAEIAIDRADTRPFPSDWTGVYDVQLLSGGDIRTIASGAFTITGDVTWATS